MRILPVLAAAATLVLAGCGTVPTSPPATSAAPVSPTSGPSPDPAVADFLARHGLDGLSPQEVVETLDASEDDRENGPIGSVRPSELVLSDEQTEVVVPLPPDAFYLAFAPYREQTHDCYNHNLATCQGELAGETMKVSVVDDSGATLVDQDVTTHANGFAGIWLPRDITATLTVSQGGDVATSPIATGPKDPTCLTTLELT